ncbi:MAG: hypothetical protein NTV77_01680 [Candidatus Azambacteria bacterium]|nr:hypothetical protein [Candidatus Azambacteria bacterium]
MKFQFVFGFMLLILVFVAIFVGAPYLLQIIKSNQFLNFPRFISTSTPGYFYSKPQPSISQPQSQPIIKPGESLYKNKMSIGNIYRYGNGQINLRASYFEGALNITGWKVKSAQRGETLIGRGINLPQFDAATSDIWLISGESVEIIAGVSPLANNFRVNNCFGGLSSLYNLGYAFSCPGIEPSNLSGLDSSCQDLILRSTSCRAPSDDILNKQSSQCRIWFEKNVNYNACVNKHQNDKDFYKGWQIYTGNNNLFFDRLHDRIELRDQAGLLVDSYEY